MLCDQGPGRQEGVPILTQEQGRDPSRWDIYSVRSWEERGEQAVPAERATERQTDKPVWEHLPIDTELLGEVG